MSGREYPSIPRQAANLARAVAAHVADGLAVLGRDEHFARVAACEGCPSYDPGPAGCRECGCSVAIKARWRSESCPLGKWDRSDAPA